MPINIHQGIFLNLDSQGRGLNLTRYFQFGLILKKMCKITGAPKLITLVKSSAALIKHIFEDGTNLKKPSRLSHLYLFTSKFRGII